ncbi:MAG: hypothetical protein JWM27_3756 [Gemmatimonadetes bacterium]|nr:hypothetical protein [Gemmatimonadota bacterium]
MLGGWEGGGKRLRDFAFAPRDATPTEAGQIATDRSVDDRLSAAPIR